MFIVICIPLCCVISIFVFAGFIFDNLGYYGVKQRPYTMSILGIATDAKGLIIIIPTVNSVLET